MTPDPTVYWSDDQILDYAMRHAKTPVFLVHLNYATHPDMPNCAEVRLDRVPVVRRFNLQTDMKARQA